MQTIYLCKQANVKYVATLTSKLLEQTIHCKSKTQQYCDITTSIIKQLRAVQGVTSILYYSIVLKYYNF